MSGYFSDRRPTYHPVSSSESTVPSYQQGYTAHSFSQSPYAQDQAYVAQTPDTAYYGMDSKQSPSVFQSSISPTASIDSPSGRPKSTASFSAPSHHQLGHSFRRFKQFRRHLLAVIARFMLSVLFSGAIAGLLYYYHQKEVLDNDQKHFFNAYFLALSLLLSLNTLSSFKSLINNMVRWTVLSSVRYGGHTAKELDLILQMSSYQTCVRLLCKHWYKRKPLYFIMLLSWVCLGIGAQVCLALLGLCFEQETDGAQSTSPGLVNATDLTKYYTSIGGLSKPPVVPQFYEANYMSHLYGDISTSTLLMGDPSKGAKGLDMPPEDLDVIYLSEEPWQWQYNFKEYVYKPQLQSLYNKTSRYIKTKASCHWAPIVKGQSGYMTLDDPWIIVDLSEYGRGMYNASQLLGYGQYTARGGTTYFSQSLNANETERADNPQLTNIDCGPRCGIVQVFRFTMDENEDGDYWACNITVSKVENAKYREHEFPDDMALRAAASIGSNSFYVESLGQYQIYNEASWWANWGWQSLNDTEDKTATVRLLVSQFAIGSIGALDALNPRIEIQGARAWTGIRLEVKWLYVWLNFGLLLGSHAVVGLLAVLITNSTYCKDDSYLSTARLLRPLVDRLGTSGSAATGDEIASLFKGFEMRYGVRKDGPAYHLDIIQESKNFVRSRGERFPKGYYD